MKVTFETTNPQDVAEAAGLCAVLQGHTGTVGTSPAPRPPVGAPAGAGTPPPPSAPAAAHTQADVSAAIQKYAQANSPKAAKAKLAELGFAKAGDVTADSFARVIAALAV